MNIFCASLLRRTAASALSFLIAGTLAGIWSPAAGQSTPAAAASALAQGASGTVLATRTDAALSSAADAGPLPGSQPLTVTLTLAPSADRTSALLQLLTAQATPGSTGYRKFLTPMQFAAEYGASADQIAAVSAWAEAAGLTVEAVSPAAVRLTLTGSAASVQSAFAAPIHQFQIAGAMYFANTMQPSLPASLAPLVAGVDGLDDLPANEAMTVQTANAKGVLSQVSAGMPALGLLVDANATPVLVLDSALCAANVSASQMAEYTLLFRQANAQGITILSTRACPDGAFPATLAEVTAASLPDLAADSVVSSTPRPWWQIAAGLPADGFRYAPDLTASSLSALAQTVQSVAASSRLGNINSALYELASTPELFTQPDSATVGTWEAATGLGLVNLKVLAEVLPRTGAGSATINLSYSPNSPTHGTPFTITATVISNTGGAAPGGSVTISSSNSNFPGTVINLGSNGVGTSSGFLLPGGSYPLTAMYSGDTNYAPTQTTSSVNVATENATFTLSTLPSTTALGSSIQVTATLTAPEGFGTPTGTITLNPNGISGAGAVSQAVSGSGASASTTFTFTANQAGNVSFSASCSTSDQSFTCYTPPPNVTTNVPKATPSVGLTLSNNSPTAGTTITASATVSGVSGVTPTGTVQFLNNGSTYLGSGTLPNATASITLQRGTNSVTASYQGDNNYLPLASAATVPNVGLAPTTTSFTVTPASPAFGQSVMLAITVAPTSGSTVNGTAPSGMVAISVGTASYSATLTGNGAVTFTLPTQFAPGTYPVTVTYGGDNNYATSTVTNTTGLTITQTTGMITAMTSPTSFTTGSTSTLTVQLTLPGGAQIPANSSFTAVLAGVTYTGPFNINPGGNTGTGQVTLNAPLAGSYNVTINCATNADFVCNSTSVAVTSTATSTVNPSTGTTATSTTLSASSTTPTAGAAVTLTATVTAAATATAVNPIAGTVSFYDGTALLTTSTVTDIGSSGVAVASVTLTGTTTHSVTAVYSGNTIYASSTSTPAVSITTSGAAVAAAITLTVSTNNTLAGNSVTFYAQVTGATTTGATPTGSVSFYLAAPTPTLLATVGLTSAGAGVSDATYTTTGLPAGSQTVYAVYSGDANFSSVTSLSVTIGLTDFSVTFVPQTLTLPQGQSGQVTVLLTGINNFTGTVVFGCTPPPNTEISCSFSPTVLTSAGTTVLNVSTVATHSAMMRGGPLPARRGSRVEGALAGGLSFATLLCLLLPGRKRRRVPALLMALFALMLSANLGCAGSNFYSTNPPPYTDPGTPFGTAILTIDTAGTNGSIVVHHNFSYQVTVQ